MDGILVINKEHGKTSRDVVNYLNDFFEMRKIGHAGTLDPLATGVLIITLGKATKLSDILTGEDKEYITTMQLGIKTDTYDISGKVLAEVDVMVDKKQIIKAINSFQGEYEQEVPIYSAVKVKGKRLYEYARNNEEVILPKRLVNIKAIEVIKIEDNLVTFKTLVSKGTYIRSLINDIGNELGCFATMTELTRTKQGDFNLESAVNLKDLKVNDVIPIKDYLQSFPSEVVTDPKLKQITNGAIIPKTFDTEFIVYLNQNKPIAIYKEYDKNPTLAKPRLML